MKASLRMSEFRNKLASFWLSAITRPGCHMVTLDIFKLSYILKLRLSPFVVKKWVDVLGT